MSSDGRRSVFLTSDWHVGHANVLVFDKRPFKDLDHMHEVLVNNYNASVKPGDLCYFLGDMGFCKSTVLQDVVARLNGTKVLILGNHDKGATAMHRIGFDVVVNMVSMEVAGRLVTMTHCPLRGVWREDCSTMKGSAAGEHWHGEARHTTFSIPDFGQHNCHGHIHSRPGKEGRTTKILGRQFDVGVAANNYRPVSLRVIESWVATTLRT